jgi:DNA-binding transcriptional regulator YbjK
VNPERRDRLRDAAMAVLANAGGRGLTHRAVDAQAQVPQGTTKNYFPTRDALLRAVAERCSELWHAVPGPTPTDRAGLHAWIYALLDEITGERGRNRMQAYLELQSEAARKPWLAGILDTIAAADFTLFERAQRAAGLPVTAPRATSLTLMLHAAVPHLLASGPVTLAATGLDNPDQFVHDLLNTIYPVDR